LEDTSSPQNEQKNFTYFQLILVTATTALVITPSISGNNPKGKPFANTGINT
jgi:hypothetical protein